MKIKQTYRKSVFKEPVQMAAIMMLFIIGIVTFPTRIILGWFYKGDNEFVFLLADGVERLLFCVLMVYFALQFGFRLWPKQFNAIAYLAVLPALIISINNFPFVSYFSGNCNVDAKFFEIASFTLWCVGVGLFEEIAFRGVIFPLVLIKIKKIKSPKWAFLQRRPVFWTIAFSGGIFALTHLVNLFGGNIGGTFLQVGYTFLIGSMCGIIVAKTGNVFYAAAAHVIYNFCGMLVEYCGSGTMWTTPQVICTAVVGVIVGAYLVAVAFLSDRDPRSAYGMLGNDDEFTAELLKVA